MQDHYSFFDSGISAYNLLNYSDRIWKLVNSPLHYQNRLRERDYRELHEAAGFEVLEEVAEHPSEVDLSTVRALRLASRFRGGYSVEELAIRAVNVAGIKP